MHEGQEILSVYRRNNTNDYLWTKLGKRMLLVSVCLIFPLARVEKKANKKLCKSTATFIRCKGSALLGYRVHGFGAKLWNKGRCDHARIKGLTFLTIMEMTNCHKYQRHAKRKVLWNATRWYFLVSWINATSLKKKKIKFLQKLKCQYSRKTASLGQS